MLAVIADVSTTKYALTIVIGLGVLLLLVWACNRLLTRLAKHEYPLTKAAGADQHTLEAQIAWEQRMRALGATPAAIAAAIPPTVATRAKCANCKHFDLEEGKAAMELNPAFVQATKHLTPAKMLNRPAGRNGPDDPGSNVIPLKAKWTDFGACMVTNQVVYQADTCDKFELRVEA